MILESLLALSLSQAPIIHTPPVLAKSFSSSRSSFSSPSRSYSSPSRSFSSSPSRSFSSPSTSFSSPSRSYTSPSRSFSSPSVSPRPSVTPKVSTPAVSSTPSVQRISKQTTAAPPVQTRLGPVSSPGTSTTAPPIVRAPRNTQPRVVTRETYIERYHDGGITGNPFFWMWALDNNRGGSQAQQGPPPQVVVQNTDGEQVKVPASQLVVQRKAWDPLREFFVFSLGGGIGVLLARRLA